MIWIKLFIVLLFFNYGGTQQCKGGFFGSWDLTPLVDVDAGSKGTIISDPYWMFTCCGVVTAWEVRAAASGDVCLQVWEQPPATANTGMFKLIGHNCFTINVTKGPIIWKDVLDKTQQIPVKKGHLIGWESKGSDQLLLHSSSSVDVTCDFWTRDLRPDPYNPGSVYTYNAHGCDRSEKRDFAIRALVENGTPPTLTNLPSNVVVGDRTEVGSKIYTVRASNQEPLETLTFSITTTPRVPFINIHPNTGVITTTSSLADIGRQVVLTIQVSDGCLSDAWDLTIYIDQTPATDPNTTSPDAGASEEVGTRLLDLADGKVVVGLLIVALILVVLLVVAIIVLRFYTDDSKKIKPAKKSWETKLEEAKYAHMKKKNQQVQEDVNDYPASTYGGATRDADQSKRKSPTHKPKKIRTYHEVMRENLAYEESEDVSGGDGAMMPSSRAAGVPADYMAGAHNDDYNTRRDEHLQDDLIRHRSRETSSERKKHKHRRHRHKHHEEAQVDVSAAPGYNIYSETE